MDPLGLFLFAREISIHFLARDSSPNLKQKKVRTNEH